MEPGTSAGYGAALLQTLVALGLVCGLAWWLLRWGGRRALGHFGGGRVKVLERVPLDTRRSLFLVQLGERVLLLGASEQSVSLITELRAGELEDATVKDVKDATP